MTVEVTGVSGTEEDVTGVSGTEEDDRGGGPTGDGSAEGTLGGVGGGGQASISVSLSCSSGPTSGCLSPGPRNSSGGVEAASAASSYLLALRLLLRLELRLPALRLDIRSLFSRLADRCTKSFAAAFTDGHGHADAGGTGGHSRRRRSRDYSAWPGRSRDAAHCTWHVGRRGDKRGGAQAAQRSLRLGRRLSLGRAVAAAIWARRIGDRAHG